MCIQSRLAASPERDLAANRVYDGSIDEYLKDSIMGITALCRKVGTPGGLRRFQWDESKEYMLSALYPKEGPTGWGRLVAGFHGDVLPLPAEGEPWHVMEDWTDFIALIGSILFCQRAMTNGGK